MITQAVMKREEIVKNVAILTLAQVEVMTMRTVMTLTARSRSVGRRMTYRAGTTDATIATRPICHTLLYIHT